MHFIASQYALQSPQAAPLYALHTPVVFAWTAEWVIDEARAQLRHWLDAGFREPIVSFNVSAVQLRRADFADRLEASLARHGVESTSIEMEVTESIFVDESATAVSSLRRLRSTGMRVSIDDFGTGYSSFSYLTSLPVSTLKLDRTFVKDITTSASAATIATAIINMAHALGKDVVAEGVGMEMQIGLLARIGCERAQGYAIARPMPAPAFVEFWQTFRPSSFASLPDAAGRGRRRGVTQFVQLPTARPS